MTSLNVLGVPHAYTLTEPVPSGQVLVFVHGWLLSRHYWHPLIEQLAPQYQCLTYDLRGFGNSIQQLEQRQSLPAHSQFHPTSSPYGLAAYAVDLISLLKHLGICQAWLLGHSLGGSIALWAAHLAPELVQGVIGINVGGGIYIREDFQRFRNAGQQIIKFRAKWLAQVPLLDTIFSRMMVATPLARCWGKQRLADLVAAHRTAALGTLLDSTTEAEVHLLPQVVSSLGQPTYFVAGQQDRVIELKYVNHLASFHPLFQTSPGNVIGLEHCGHLAMVEQPHVLTRVIQQILARHAN
ncbi:MAG: alpha/beta hydrolase [Cyanobacteria bacterium P01_A01_bin.123]